MKKKTIIITRLIFGLFLFALGSVFAINAKIGVAPWDVFHQGVAKLTGITVGRANIYSGIIIFIIDIILGQDLGWGSIMNMILIGTFMDILMLNDLVPVFTGFTPKLIMLILGIIIQGLGCYFYISVGLGTGPRDGLMVALTKKTKRPVGIIKSSIDISVVTIGFILGGNLGIGTVIMAFFAGHIWQFIFKRLNFTISEIDHRFIQDDVRVLKEKFNKHQQGKEKTPQ
ncbi:YczE/YyaS/YitT family protein [Wansuia hejianensis]|uniref:YitT family protein n=1 Tax=Wansuia hejianensis TaxID=2763667 RepID=A0A926F2Y1_9FIRM|nr:hypothetical protein [Wansuia hejianensis]MBC8590934.1 hypothetical protein [Wansuia hejianensis]